MARVTERMAWGTSISEIMQKYADDGWVADLAVLDALASVERLEDVRAVRSAVRTVYRPWLERIVEAFQDAIASVRARRLPSGISTGGCRRNVSAIRRWSSVRSGTPPWNDVGTEGDRGGSRATSNGTAIGDRYGEACNLSCSLRVGRGRRLRNCCQGERIEGHRSGPAEGGGRCGLPGPGR